MVWTGDIETKVSSNAVSLPYRVKAQTVEQSCFLILFILYNYDCWDIYFYKFIYKSQISRLDCFEIFYFNQIFLIKREVKKWKKI